MMVQPVFFFFLTLLSLQTIHAERISDDDLPLGANVHTTHRGLTEILDYIKEVIESARTTIKNITDSLGALIKEFQENINETVSNIPIYLIINQLRSELADIVGQGGVLSQQCGKQADAQVSELITRSSKASQECKKATETAIAQLKSHFKNLATRARDILDQFTMQVVSCVQNNILNPIKLIQCLRSELDIFKQELDNIQQEFEMSVADAKIRVKESVFELASCINDVQLDTLKTSQIILLDVETCMADK
ncbi:hypothetical protein CBL_04506 [Carabus blaptoides fortunei]